MQKAIIRYIDRKNKKEPSYKISQDIVSDMIEFRQKQADKSNRRYKYLRNIEFEIVELTDRPNERFVYYALPQCERIKYDSSLVDRISDGKIYKKTVMAVSWIKAVFKDSHYNFNIMVVERVGKECVAVLISESGIIHEGYVFNGGREPFERIFF